MSVRVIIRHGRGPFFDFVAEREARKATPADRAAVHKFTEDADLVFGYEVGDLTARQTRLLLRLAQVGLAATRGPKMSARAARADELGEWLAATKPAVRNVAELRALPDFPRAARRLSDDTLRDRMRAAGITLRGGRPKKT